ncbi:MAG: helix-turn-helix domain-containing protein [Polyangiaceae bacterium]
MPAKASFTHMTQTLRPFLRMLRLYPKLQLALVETPLLPAPGPRGEVEHTEELLHRMVEIAGDEDLGLKAARAIRVGDFEVIEYTCSTAPTWRAGLLALKRYFELIDQSVRVDLNLCDGTAQVVFTSEVIRSRAGTDFLVAGFFVVAERWMSPLPDDLEICMRHAAPRDLAEYRETFGRRRISFGEAFDGVRFAAKLLDMPLRTAEATVHALLRTRAEQLLIELGSAQDAWLARVRADLLSHLPSGDIGAAAVGKRLGASPRTLARRLTEFGTSFSDQVQQIRRQGAEHYLSHSEYTLEEIAFLLGYSEAPPLVRAFRRWHGVSPGEYRLQARRGGAPTRAT